MKIGAVSQETSKVTRSGLLINLFERGGTSFSKRINNACEIHENIDLSLISSNFVNVMTKHGEFLKERRGFIYCKVVKAFKSHNLQQEKNILILHH